MKSDKVNSKVPILILFVLSSAAFLFLNTRPVEPITTPTTYSTLKENFNADDPIHQAIEFVHEIIESLHFEPQDKKASESQPIQQRI